MDFYPSRGYEGRRNEKFAGITLHEVTPTSASLSSTKLIQNASSVGANLLSASISFMQIKGLLGWWHVGKTHEFFISLLDGSRDDADGPTNRLRNGFPREFWLTEKSMVSGEKAIAISDFLE